MWYFVQYEWETRPTKGPDLHFDCPACGADDVVGETSEVIYLGRLFWVLPVLHSRETTIRCRSCGAECGVLCTLADMARKDREQLRRVVRYRAGCGGQLLAALSLLFCWNPALGLPLSLGGKWATRATKGWPRELCTVSLVLTLAVVVVVGIILVGEAVKGKP